MSDVIESGWRTIRKEHCCWGCLRKFPLNTRLFHSKNANEGTVINTYLCPICYDYVMNVMDSYDREDGFFEGDLINNNGPEFQALIDADSKERKKKLITGVEI